MTSYADLLLGLFSVFISGILVGLLIERVRLKNALKVERIKRLAPYLEQAYPILERLFEDVDYLRTLQSREGHESADLGLKACQAIEEYQLWYKLFRENGLKPELEHSNFDLYAVLDGLNVHARMVAKYGDNHLLSNVDDILEKIDFCKAEIKDFLTQ